MKIGIFWYWNNEVLGVAHDFSASDIDSIGLADSNYAHIEYWEIIQSSNKDLKYMEYEEVPRGRAIFNSKFSVHDKFHRILVLSGFFFLKIASTFLNSSFFPKPIKRRIAI